MKASTQMHAAFRNIGDSQDVGSFYHGPLKDCIVWLASQFATCTLAGRIVIGVGRTREDAERGIHVAKAGRQKVTDSMTQMLEELYQNLEFEDDSDEVAANESVDKPESSQLKVDGDTYESE